MSPPPAFQFYARDWFAATRELGPYGRGVYIDMLCLEWENGSIVDDVRAVAMAVGAELAPLKRVWPLLRAKFTDEGAPPGRLINRRLETTRAEQERHRAEQVRKGHLGAAARWPKHSPSISTGTGTGSPQGQAEGLLKVSPDGSSPTPSPTPADQQQREYSAHAGARVMGGVTPALLQKAWHTPAEGSERWTPMNSNAHAFDGLASALSALLEREREGTDPVEFCQRAIAAFLGVAALWRGRGGPSLTPAAMASDKWLSRVQEVLAGRIDGVGPSVAQDTGGRNGTTGRRSGRVPVATHTDEE